MSGKALIAAYDAESDTKDRHSPLLLDGLRYKIHVILFDLRYASEPLAFVETRRRLAVASFLVDFDDLIIFVGSVFPRNGARSEATSFLGLQGNLSPRTI